MRPLSPLSPANILERLGSARELDIASEKLDWSGLAAVYRTEHADEPSDSGSDGVMEIKINSGGVVYFAAFQYPKPPREQGEGGPSETGGTHRGNLGSPLGPYHASQMAVTTSQEGAAMVVRAYGSQGMTQLTFPSPMTAHPGATSPGAPLEPAAPPSPQGASGQELDTGAGPERSEATGAGLKVRTASRMAKPSAGTAKTTLPISRLLQRVHCS